MNAPTPYEARVAELEAIGFPTSDAQGVAEVEFAQRAALPMLAALRVCASAERERRAKLLPGAPATTYTEARIALVESAIARAEGRS